MKIISLMLTCLVFLAWSPATAGEKFTTNGAFCESEATITEFVLGFDRHNALAQIAAVNARSGRTSCHLTTVLLEEVERTKIMDTPTGKWQLVKVLIYGAIISEGVMAAFPAPVTNYTLVEIAPKPDQAI